MYIIYIVENKDKIKKIKEYTLKKIKIFSDRIKEFNLMDNKKKLKAIKDFLLGDNIIVFYVRQIIIGLLIVAFLNTYIFMTCVVDGTSMYPLLKEGQKCFSFIFTRNISIERFDIIVAKVYDDDHLYVKRVIGMPNETISYRNNRLYVNGEYYKEDFLQDGVETNDFEVTLGQDEYYLLGDNRASSSDSRYFGPVNKSDILSSHIFVFSPLQDMGFRK